MKAARFLPEVFDDLSAAANQYDDAGGVALGNRFIQCFYSAVHRASATAESHRSIYREYRRVLMEPFPYKLFFRLVGSDVVFSLLIHAARDPRVVEQILRSRT
jgi:hypothetical protein